MTRDEYDALAADIQAVQALVKEEALADPSSDLRPHERSVWPPRFSAIVVGSSISRTARFCGARTRGIVCGSSDRGPLSVRRDRDRLAVGQRRDRAGAVPTLDDPNQILTRLG